jgi:predicted lipoprotein with Yx(FWY)xxD motif
VTSIRALCVVAAILSACGGAASPAAVAPSATVAAPGATAATPTYGGTAGDDYGYGYGNDPKASSAPVAVSGTLTILENAKLGKLLAASNGMILYTFKLDKPNTTTCVDLCAKDWPPFVITSGAPIAPVGIKGILGTITRPDGSTQVTYNGFPLHFFAGDLRPGDTNGEGFGDVWFSVKGP